MDKSLLALALLVALAGIGWICWDVRRSRRAQQALADQWRADYDRRRAEQLNRGERRADWVRLAPPPPPPQPTITAPGWVGAQHHRQQELGNVASDPYNYFATPRAEAIQPGGGQFDGGGASGSWGTPSGSDSGGSSDSGGGGGGIDD